MKKYILIILILMLILVVFKVFDIYSLLLRKAYPDMYANFVEECSKKYNIEKEWIFALIKSESNFDKDVVSSKGAKGLMQLMESTAHEIALEIRNRRYRFI